MVKSKHLLIVYHSQSGTTRTMADAVIKGAKNPDINGVEIQVRDALEASADDVLWADGLLLGTPENFGYMSGAIKYFLDRIYYPCEDKIDGMPYALFVCAGNDGTGAIKSITRILKGLAIKQIQEPVLIVGDVDDSQLKECEELGMIMAAGLESGIF
ncbi:MAG: flavodoxin [Gammaproteobacteria bacterium]|nr:flavodoxin [Gammaproteobacteria bacterium]